VGLISPMIAHRRGLGLFEIEPSDPKYFKRQDAGEPDFLGNSPLPLQLRELRPFFLSGWG
jgi:hypothetical protein